LAARTRPVTSEDLGYTFPVLTDVIGNLAMFSSKGPSPVLPEDPSILVLWLETLVRKTTRTYTSKDPDVLFLFFNEGIGDLALFSSGGPDKPAPHLPKDSSILILGLKILVT
jgi:hypothetical protein